MASGREAVGKVIECCPLPDAPFKSEEDAYRWGVKVVQGAASRIHGNLMSLRARPVERKNGLKRVRVSVRSSTVTFFYSLVQRGKRRVGIIQMAVQDERNELLF